jgi:hypothetical protein
MFDINAALYIHEGGAAGVKERGVEAKVCKCTNEDARARCRHL